jgi:hypothetical protein
MPVLAKWGGGRYSDKQKRAIQIKDENLYLYLYPPLLFLFFRKVVRKRMRFFIFGNLLFCGTIILQNKISFVCQLNPKKQFL